jgi:hypothetical protein
MKRIILLALILSTTISCAQDLNVKVKGNREPTTQITEVPPFRVLQIDSDYEVAIVKGIRTQVELTTDSNLHQFIKINQVGDKLVIGSTAKIRSKREMKFRITFGPELNSIIVAEDAELSGVTDLIFKKLDLNIDGDARVYLTAQVDNLTLLATGDSKSELNLTGKTATINFTDNADVKALITYDNVEMLLKDRVDIRIEGDVDEGKITLQDRIELKADNLIFDKLSLFVSHNAKAEVNVKKDLIIEADKDADITVHNSAKIELNKFEDNSVLRKK